MTAHRRGGDGGIGCLPYMTNLTHNAPEQPAAALTVDPSKVILPQQYPAWTDGHGWNQPQQYKTIQVGDIDGDGFDELIGRGPNGIEVYKWSQTTHIWELLSGDKPLPFSDKDGWTTPKRYLNIILADINGDKKAELIGLDEHKLYAYFWDATLHVWKALSVLNLPGAWAWDEKSRIQAADLNGDGKAELIFHYVDWLVKIALSDSNEWSNTEAFQLSWLKPDTTILLGDIDGDGKAEIVTSDTSGTQIHRWAGNEVPQEYGSGRPGDDWSSSVQLADVDGDGKAEIIMRRLGGLYYHVVAFRVEAGGSWNQMNLRDETDGIHDPEYFSTVQFADIDGDGKAELIARSPEGLIAFRLEAGQVVVGHEIATATGVMADADGWDVPQCCLTIQTARIGGGDNGFAKFAVIGRGPDGIQTWQWSADTGPARPLPGGAVAKLGFRTTGVNGFHQPTEPGFPEYSNSPGHQKLSAYQLLSQYLLDPNAAVWPPAVPPTNPLFKDIRGAYIDSLKKTHWIDMVGKLAKLPSGPVNDISAADIDEVRKQLQTELMYVDCAYAWFGNIRDVLNGLFPAEDLTVTIVAGRITVSPDSTTKVILDIASVLAAIVGAIMAVLAGVLIAGSGGTAAPVVLPMIAAITALIALSLRVGSTYAGNGGSKALELEVRHVREKLLDNWMHAPLANDHLLEVFLQHWGFLRQLGEKITALQVQWPPTLTDQMVVQGRHEYELGVWQTLSQSIWWVVGYKQEWTSKYGRWVDGKYLLITTYKYGSDYATVPNEILDRLFGQPDQNNPTGPFGVPLMDVMNSRNGWRLNYNSYTPPPHDSPWLLLHSRVNPAPRRLT